MNYKFDKSKHLHLLNEKPLTGTSSIVSVLAKPLTWWASGLAVGTLGWCNSKEFKEQDRIEKATPMLNKIKRMTVQEYIKTLDKAYRAHKDSLDKSASKGIDLHAELERFVKDKLSNSLPIVSYSERIEPFIEWSEKNVKKWLWSEAHCFSYVLWTGGICDSGAEMNNGAIAVFDYKSAKDAYTSHFIQAAGYALEIEENGLFDSQGNQTMKLDQLITNIYIVPFGAKDVTPVINKEPISKYKEGFADCTRLYRLLGLDKEN